MRRLADELRGGGEPRQLLRKFRSRLGNHVQFGFETFSLFVDVEAEGHGVEITDDPLARLEDDVGPPLPHLEFHVAFPLATLPIAAGIVSHLVHRLIDELRGETAPGEVDRHVAGAEVLVPAIGLRGDLVDQVFLFADDPPAA